MKSTRHKFALLCTIVGFGAVILEISMFDLFQIWVYKTYENELEIVAVKTGGHIKIDEFAVRLVFS